LLENHGVVTSGQDLTTAYYRMETVEQCARILLTAETLGGPHLLPRREVHKLIAARSGHSVLSSDDVTDLRLTPDVSGNRVTLPRS
jgi:L-fuculose-phosphate aldolase